MGGVFDEVVRLPCHRANAAHLPHEPLIDGNAITLGCAAEFASFASEVLQDRTAFKDGNGIAIGSVRIGDGGHAVVGGDFEEISSELIAFYRY